MQLCVPKHLADQAQWDRFVTLDVVWRKQIGNRCYEECLINAVISLARLSIKARLS